MIRIRVIASGNLWIRWVLVVAFILQAINHTIGNLWGRWGGWADKFTKEGEK